MILINGCIAKMLKACIVARGVWLENNDFGSVFGSVLQQKTGLFGLVLVFKINCGFVFWFVFLHSSISAIFHLCLYSMMLEMMYFRAELI